MTQIVFSWIGETDLKGFEQKFSGPIEGFLSSGVVTAKNCFLLYSYSKKRVKPYLQDLADRFPQQTITPVSLHLANPTSYAEIFPLVQQLLTEQMDLTVHHVAQLNFFISPGTPTMQTIWVLLAKTQFPAVCWSGYQDQYTVVDLPFNIQVEYLEKAKRRADDRLNEVFENKALPKSFEQIHAQSAIMKEQIQKAFRLSKHNVPVLILGPTGSGKEVFARSIHQAGLQQAGSFVAVNCGALPKDLAESILFGHKRGAFTGATSDQEGLIRQAHQGTLFLDEIGELTLDLQVKLLRVLQEKSFRPIGAKADENSEFRLIAATHRDLLSRVEEGSFREDLFYRIAVGVIQLPALIERAEDIELLTHHLLDSVNSELRDQPGYISKNISQDVIKVIKNHDWPGNIRELRTTLQRVCAWSDEPMIDAATFSDAIIKRPLKSDAVSLKDISQGIDLDKEISKIQQAYIASAELLTGGQITKMAQLLGFKNHQTLRKRMASIQTKT